MKSLNTTKDIYKVYAQALLKQNKDWWGKFDQKIPNFRIYSAATVTGKPKEMMSYPRFKAIISAWFKGATEYIIEGQALMMGSSLGRIAARRVERNQKTKTIDWKATTEMWKSTGERKGLLYRLDEDWVRIGWEKSSRIKNERFYRFTPAEGNKSGKGFKLEFSKANEENELLKYKYRFYPFINYSK